MKSLVCTEIVTLPSKPTVLVLDIHGETFQLVSYSPKNTSKEVEPTWLLNQFICYRVFVVVVVVVVVYCYRFH